MTRALCGRTAAPHKALETRLDAGPEDANSTAITIALTYESHRPSTLT